MTLFADLLEAYLGPPGTRTNLTEPAWPGPPWLPLSWKKPQEFFVALCAEAEEALGGPAKSLLATGIDFYADAILRYLHRRREPLSPALRWYDEAEGWQSLSLLALDAQASALASVLVAAGAEPGERLALVLPSGAPLLIGLMAALHVGCLVVPVLPYGSTYVQKLLGLSEAKRVITCAPYTALRGLLDYRPLVLSKELLAQAGRRPPTATYAPDAPAFLISSPLRDPDTLVELTAADAYGAALRDGLLIFGLRPGGMLAAPKTAQYLPAMQVAALLCGAGLTELSAQAVRMDASPLFTTPPRTVVLTRAVRDALAESADKPVAWGCWFLDPQEGFDVPGWERAERRLRLMTIPHANLLFDAAAGGTVLVSEVRRGPPHPYLAPAPGCRHMLGGLYAEGPAVTDVGRLVLLGGDRSPAGSPGEALFLQTENGYMYGGTALPRRAGWAYPARDVLAVLKGEKELPALVGASVVELAGSGPFGHALFVLVLFTGGQSGELLDTASYLALLDRELGPAASPDRVEVFPLYPRRQGGVPDGDVDADWVRGQYVGGDLYQKTKSPLFRALTRVRAALLMTVRG